MDLWDEYLSQFPAMKDVVGGVSYPLEESRRRMKDAPRKEIIEQHLRLE